MNEEHFEDYLWDRSGAPDEELRALETLLECYRYEIAAPTIMLTDPASEAVHERE